MIVVVLTACPVGLRGDLTRWLLEISAGVFVGHVNARVRDKLWERIVGLMRDGRAIMVYSARNEQHFAFRVHRAKWTPEDCDGLTLVKRPTADAQSESSRRRSGWSNAGKRRAARKYR
ncbi:type I-E CRISPR-associated endoribonuclease Cas2e [Bifidobacterium catulorum]|uniref:Type I-E CRISPR-associated endoribonuclease Cas2 n=1 Tax=Bifidobacterium catulorum TaxID=1630173 RepID=A0A2U2MTT7_9BIFI|nr:type I-E CRISPR-associated endoribonuclease Cas2e [Bifidobacterium catulorum]PWG60234.1 type I-E CRISPR-associated endoribonuclease Cas2 [Bifidobacterium catulorum]